MKLCALIACWYTWPITVAVCEYLASGGKPATSGAVHRARRTPPVVFGTIAVEDDAPPAEPPVIGRFPVGDDDSAFGSDGVSTK